MPDRVGPARRTFRSMSEICETFFPERHADRECECPMPDDPWRAYHDGELSMAGLVRALDQPRPKWSPLC